jgi:tetratricopeptide (TPR) repeat protein
MNLSGQLATLEAWGLIQPVVAGARVEFRFRHALVHDAAYVTLLKQQRRELHRAVGDVLDGEYGQAPELMAPVLAFHFSEGGEPARASRYFAIAGDNAARKFAHQEAASYYSQAIQAAPQAASALFQSRGQVYELQGAFEAARLDFERAAELAQAAGDLPAEWQATISLGLLWAGRDYQRCGEYCHMAFELAEKTGQPALVARSYNRLGNWHLNEERPLEAARCHDQALTIFQSIHDEDGIAETLDLLGMSSMLGGEMPRAARYYQEAIELNQRLGNQLALANVLGSQLLAAACGFQAQTLRPSLLAYQDLTAQGQQALRMAHELGWRDHEAFVNMMLSMYGQGRGDYALALSAGAAGLRIATDINHRQWMAGLHYALGLIYLDMLALPQAVEELETGLALSLAIGSLHWTRCHVGMLTLTYVAYGTPERAAALQATAGEVRHPPQSIGERLVVYGQAHLAQARGELRPALDLMDTLIATAGARMPGEPEAIPMLYLARGELMAALDDVQAGELALRLGLEAAGAHGERPLQWRLYQGLGRLLEHQGRAAEAEQALGRARAIVSALAVALPDEDLAENFRLQTGLFAGLREMLC